ncbi:hypothetical protein VP01_141g5 [Puccinia sorghi]|uniref:BED-type domain-containing protein n=1 Tax=Puccinia sorghi TaxID=27349 RepID=A0A0L6VL67_9BASI|nr:hypothetical protein VP01_141g5 [Puccinia sorghi]
MVEGISNLPQERAQFRNPRKEVSPGTSSALLPSKSLQDLRHNPGVRDGANRNQRSKRNFSSNKRSWVWNHLKEEDGVVICQVVTKSGEICGKNLKKDNSCSTKNLHGHLLQIHCLADPHLTKKTKMNHIDMQKWSKSGSKQAKVYAWLAPNVTAFMAVTAHFIDDKYNMWDLTIAVPHIEGTLSTYF